MNPWRLSKEIEARKKIYETAEFLRLYTTTRTPSAEEVVTNLPLQVSYAMLPLLTYLERDDGADNGANNWKILGYAIFCIIFTSFRKYLRR